MASISRAAGAIVWFVLVCFRWFKTTFYDPLAVWSLESVLVATEETLKSAVREIFAVVIRSLNGFSAWIVSIFVDKSYYKALRTNLTRAHAWQSWWSNECYSTFNALIERDKPARSDGAPSTSRLEDSTGSRGKASKSWSSYFPSFQTFPWPTTSSGKTVKRTGSDLFENPAGWAVQENSKKRGFLEDIQLGFELAVTKCFDFVRWLVGMLLFVPNPSRRPTSTAWRSRRNFQRQVAPQPSVSSAPPLSARVKRTRSFSKGSAAKWTTGDVILQAGYPLEEHKIVTEDGYVITMERIPGPGARDVVFFLHGIMDTSLGWVANGVTGSQAFAAADQGLDVWLGSSRANPPRTNIDPLKQGGRYWHYTVNEMGILDVGSQIDFIHKVKCRELTSERRQPPAPLTSSPSLLAPTLTICRNEPRWQRSLSDSALYASSHVCGGGAADWQEGRAREEGWSSSSSSGSTGYSSPIDTSLSGAQPLGRGALASASLPSSPAPFSQPTFAVPPSDSSSAYKESQGRTEDLRPGASATSSASSSGSGGASSAIPSEPYRLRAVAHSLGGAMVLIHCVTRRLAARPHHIHRLILLTPAGYIKSYPLLALPFILAIPVVVGLLKYLRPGCGAPAIIIPTSLLRYITFKLTFDLQNLPALNELMGAGIRMLLNGDKSEWDRAMLMPHYNTQGMPALSFHTGAHLVQWVKTRKFKLFDYGSARENYEHYGQSTPPDIGGNYKLIDIPVDVLAGKADGVISKDNVRWHYDTMKAAGCEVTYKEFDFGHLDFTIAMKDDLRHYVLSRLLLREG